jgi:hypothetical protein
MKDTTNRLEYKGMQAHERSRPIKHMDNLGNVNLKMNPSLYSTNYRANFVQNDDGGTCKREEERIEVRRELKQLQ